MPRCLLLLLVPLLCGSDALGLVHDSTLVGGQTCDPDGPLPAAHEWQARDLVRIDASGVEPVKLGEAVCRVGECGGTELTWSLSGPAQGPAVLVESGAVPTGRLLWPVVPQPPPPDLPACRGPGFERPVTRRLHQGGPAASFCSAAIAGELAVQSRGDGWMQPTGWPRYTRHEWRLLRRADAGWTAITPWFEAGGEDATGPDHPLLLAEVEADRSYELVFVDRGGVGGPNHIWRERIQRSTEGEWTLLGGPRRPAWVGQPCD